MKDFKPCDSTPDAPSPAARSDGEDDRERRCTSKHEAQLRSVPGRPPEHTEAPPSVVPVFSTTAVVFASREWAAGVIRVTDLTRFTRAGEVDEGGLAALEEAVGNAGVGAEYVWRVSSEPVGLCDGEYVL